MSEGQADIQGYRTNMYLELVLAEKKDFNLSGLSSKPLSALKAMLADSRHLNSIKPEDFFTTTFSTVPYLLNSFNNSF